MGEWQGGKSKSHNGQFTSKPLLVCDACFVKCPTPPHWDSSKGEHGSSFVIPSLFENVATIQRACYCDSTIFNFVRTTFCSPNIPKTGSLFRYGARGKHHIQPSTSCSYFGLQEEENAPFQCAAAATIIFWGCRTNLGKRHRQKQQSIEQWWNNTSFRVKCFCANSTGGGSMAVKMLVSYCAECKMRPCDVHYLFIVIYGSCK